MTDPQPPRPRPLRGPAPRLGTLALAGVLALAAAACTGGGGASPSAAPASPPASPAPGDGASGEPIGDVPPAVIDNAKADAAGRAGVDPAEVTVVVAEAHDWPNGALGCPEPDMLYTEVITPGYRVVVEAGGTEFDYRASTRSSDVQWCENPPPM
jgi:hypothetical protein